MLRFTSLSHYLITLAAGLFAGMAHAETTCFFFNTEADPEEGYMTTGLQFILSDDSWSGPEEEIETEEEIVGTVSYSIDIEPNDIDADFPEQHVLDIFTVMHCSAMVGQGSEAAEQRVWGIITETETGITLGGAFATLSAGGSALDFDFTGAALTLNAYESYTLNFVCSDASSLAELGIDIGESYGLTNSEIFVHAAQKIEYEDGYVEQFDSNEYLSYQEESHVGALAPAIYITTHSVPEPATGTLGLLALSALAARRRRK